MMDRTPSGLQEQMDELLRRCREAGMNVTPQRMAIYRALLEAEDHPSPEALYRRVASAMPALSLATVYKALDALVQLGLVREVSVTSDTKRYDANLDRHHHLVCTGCGSVTDFYSEALDEIAPPSRIDGFVTSALSVQVFGVCSDCAKRTRS